MTSTPFGFYCRDGSDSVHVRLKLDSIKEKKEERGRGEGFP